MKHESSKTIGVTEASRILGYTRYWTAELARQGEIPATQRRPGCAWRFDLNTLKRFMRNGDGSRMTKC